MKDVALATKHGKEQAFGRPLSAGLGFRFIVPEFIDTDAFGTFSGEIERVETPLETAYGKARCGMNLTGLPRGLASEGSFGAHPVLPFAVAGCEILVFIDDIQGFRVSEQIVSERTNFAATEVSLFDELENFLQTCGFPSHAVIVCPNLQFDSNKIYKGLQSVKAVRESVNVCRNISVDSRVRIETDMRAHSNPTRMRVLRRLAVKLARRLLSLCPQNAERPVSVWLTLRGLKCALCGLPTLLVQAEIHACAKCDF